MWIESHQSLARHPKLIRLAATLKINKAQAIGHLHLLWWWTLDYAPSGSVSAFASCEIAAAAEWTGDADRFLEALKKEKWIDEDGSVHDWDEYAGKLLARKKADADRKASVRKKSAGHPADVQETSARTVPNQPTNQPPPVGGEAPPAPPAEPPPHPKKANGPKMADAEFLEELRGLYPWVNIDAEEKRARAYLLKPQCKGRYFTRDFFINWLNRIPAPMAKASKPAATVRQEALPDPEWWKNYLAAHPHHEGLHFAQLSRQDQETAKDWGFAQNQGEWAAAKSLHRTAA